ncbi:MAG: hypothetical protein ABIQ64_01905 [Candidatus Saccharimonadales bacterium]
MNQKLDKQPMLQEDEILAIRTFDGIKVINYRQSSPEAQTVIGGEPWKIVGTGESSDGQPLAIVEHPVTKDLTPVRLDHLNAPEYIQHTKGSQDLGELAVDQVVSTGDVASVSHTPTKIRIINNAQ